MPTPIPYQSISVFPPVESIPEEHFSMQTSLAYPPFEYSPREWDFGLEVSMRRNGQDEGFRKLYAPLSGMVRLQPAHRPLSLTEDEDEETVEEGEGFGGQERQSLFLTVDFRLPISIRSIPPVIKFRGIDIEQTRAAIQALVLAQALPIDQDFLEDFFSGLNEIAVSAGTWISSAMALEEALEPDWYGVEILHTGHRAFWRSVLGQASFSDMSHPFVSHLTGA